MAESDFKVTVLGAINEVRGKTKLPPVTTIDQDADSITKLSYLNDIVADISDYGNWQEQYREAIVSVQASVRDYAVSGVVIQNIHEIAISTRTAALKRIDIDDIRQLRRINNTGEPYHWCLKGTNGEGNPIISFERWPTSADTTKYFNIGYYEKPAVYVTANVSSTVPFPGRLVVQGLLTKTILDESDGEPTQRYLTNLQLYETMKDESFNRFNGDTGGDTYFRPGKRKR